MARFLHADNLGFSLLQWFYWSGAGLVFTFLPAYYQSLGYSGSRIGWAMSLVSAAPLLGQPLLGMWSDKLRRSTPVLLWGLAVGAAFTGILGFSWVSFAAITLFAVLASLALQSLPPLIDHWTLDQTRLFKNLDYGFSRSMGSVGYSVTMVLAGLAFDQWGLSLMFPLGAVFFVLSGGLVLSIHRRSARREPLEPPTHEAVTKIRESFFSREMVSLLLLAVVAFTALRTVPIFLPLLISNLGGTNADLGFSFGIMGMSEVPFMILCSWLLLRMSDTRIILLSFVFFLVRIVVHVIAPSPEWVIAAQALQGPSFGLFLPAFVHLLFRISPPGSKAFAQTAGSLATFGLGSVFASALGGFLIEAIGIVPMYASMSLLMAVTVVGFYFFQVRPVSGRIPATGELL